MAVWARPRPRGAYASRHRRPFGLRRRPTPPPQPVSVVAPSGARAAGDAVSSAQALYAFLQRQGIAHVYGVVDAAVSVLSLPGGITVWCQGGVFVWRGRDGSQHRVPGSQVEAAGHRLLVAMAR